jgi:hypothetical protein
MLIVLKFMLNDKSRFKEKIYNKVTIFDYVSDDILRKNF